MQERVKKLFENPDLTPEQRDEQLKEWGIFSEEDVGFLEWIRAKARNIKGKDDVDVLEGFHTKLRNMKKKGNDSE
jgi:hypothetical protein